VIALDRIVTFARPSGFRIVAELGTVRAEATARSGLLSGALRAAWAFLGFAPPEIVTDAERARALCVGTLRDRADAVGANGVIAVAFDAVVQTDGATRVRATGTAVVLEPEPATA